MSFSNTKSQSSIKQKALGGSLTLSKELNVPTILLNNKSLQTTLDEMSLRTTTLASLTQNASSLASGCTGTDLDLSSTLTTSDIFLGGSRTSLNTTLTTLSASINLPKIASSLATGCTGSDLTLTGTLKAPTFYIGTDNIGTLLSTLTTYTSTNHVASGLASGATGVDLTLSGALTTTAVSTPSIIINSTSNNQSVGYQAGTAFTFNYRNE